jgi:hypothetical protein
MAEEDNPFESPRLLLDGARRHIESFNARLEELRLTPGWSEAQMGGTDGEILIKINVAVPAVMKQIVFDITNNLRSALDHAVFASALLLTGQELDNTKFPFGDTEKDAFDDARRRAKNVPPAVVALLLSFGPYRYGNPVLYGLNKLRNTKSHRVLVPMAASAEMTSAGEATEGSTAEYEWDQATGRLKVSLQREPGVPMGAVLHTFRLELLIGTGIFRGEPAPAVFERMFSEVERVVSGIEAETVRLMEERSIPLVS